MADRLPVYDLEPDLVAALRSKRRVLVSAPTGSGKSTQVPQMLLAHGFLEKGQAVVLQPRRIAARMLAARVAEERGARLGEEVGYQVRFENRAGPATKIRFVTEGLLLRQSIADPLLKGVAALVVDSGLARIARHDPRRALDTLFVEKISRASADQRAGRAGRTAPGECIRLWDAKDHAARPAREEPEVKRVDLAEAVLLLSAAGVENARDFRWLDPPDEKSLSRAEDLLLDLGALQSSAASPARPPARPPAAPPALSPTPLGRRMLSFPLHPRYSRMLLAAGDLRCAHDAALAAALTQGRDLLVRHADPIAAGRRDDLLGDRDSSDFLLLMRAWQLAAESRFSVDACRRAGIHAQAARQVGPAFDMFLRVAEREGLDVKARGTPEALRQCLLIGFPDRVARRVDAATGRCEMVHGRKGQLARESVVRAPLFVAAEVREVEGRSRGLNTIFSLATAIEPAWLDTFFPEAMSRRVEARFDAERKRAVAEERTRFHDLLIASRPVDPPADEAAKLLAEEVLAGRLELRKWDAATDQWILRVNFLARACPDLGLAPLGDAERRAAVERICAGGVSWNDVKDRPVADAVRASVEPALRAVVEKHAPERVALSNGRTPKVVYDAEKPPRIALRIQELFGVTRLPAVAAGRVPLAVEILSPASRPVQVTQDLARFWQEHYPALKKELQRKYPKHEWR